MEQVEFAVLDLLGNIQPGPYGKEHIGLSHGLHFTGGEPFMNFELLCRALEIASNLDIPSVFVETNCYWCTDDSSTREKLLLLREKGLKGPSGSVPKYSDTMRSSTRLNTTGVSGHWASGTGSRLSNIFRWRTGQTL